MSFNVGRQDMATYAFDSDDQRLASLWPWDPAVNHGLKAWCHQASIRSNPSQLYRQRYGATDRCGKARQ